MENNYLYRSLTQDLKCLNNLTKTMMNTSSLEIRSWLDPRKTFSESDDITSFCVSDESARLTCLELIIDRLYIIINLNINYLELQQKVSKNRAKPTNLTIGASASLLWSNIQKLIARNRDLKEVENIVTVNNFDYNSNQQRCKNKSVQACLEYSNCKNCDIAQHCIKFITMILKIHENDDNISEATKAIQNNIFDMTQEESMDKLTTAIMENIEKIVKLNGVLTSKLESRELLYKSIVNAYRDALNKIVELSGNLQNLEKLRSEDTEMFNRMQEQINQLHYDKFQMETTLKAEKEKLHRFEDQLAKNDGIIANLRTEVQNLQKNLSTVIMKEEFLSAEKQFWKTRFINVQNDNQKILSLNADMERETKDLKDKIDVIIQKVVALEQKTENSIKDIDNNTRYYENLLMQMQDVVKSTVIINDKISGQMEVCSHVKNDIVSDFEVQGNPLLDMVKQIEVNKLNMQKLENQNAHLTKTVEKFHHLCTTKNS